MRYSFVVFVIILAGSSTAFVIFYKSGAFCVGFISLSGIIM